MVKQLRKGITHWKDRSVDGKILNFKAEITEQENGNASCAVFLNDQLINISGESKDLLRMFPSFDIAVNYIKAVKEKVEQSNNPDTTTILRTKTFSWIDFDAKGQIKVTALLTENPDLTVTTSFQFSNDPTPEIAQAPNWDIAVSAIVELIRIINSKNITRN